MSSTPLGIWNRIVDTFSIPDEGTAIRPFVRNVRLQIQSFYSDSSKKINLLDSSANSGTINFSI